MIRKPIYVHSNTYNELLTHDNKKLQKISKNPYSFCIKKWNRSSSFHLRTSLNPSLRVKTFISSSADRQFVITTNFCPTSILSNSVRASTSGNEQQSPEQSKTFFGFSSLVMLIHSQITWCTKKQKRFLSTRIP